jgi:hypothetical protein
MILPRLVSCVLGFLQQIFKASADRRPLNLNTLRLKQREDISANTSHFLSSCLLRLMMVVSGRSCRDPNLVSYPVLSSFDSSCLHFLDHLSCLVLPSCLVTLASTSLVLC